MKKILNMMISIILFSIIVSPQICFAEKILKIAFGNALPPWVNPETDQGILIDIIKETLEPAEYKIEPVYLPYARRLVSYKRHLVDAVCDINSIIMEESKLEGHLSAMAYAYENIGVSLMKNRYKFSKISDLTNYRVLAWQGAKETIGGEYAIMAQKNKDYRELASQKTQIILLYTGREDVIQLDRQIFKFYKKRVSEEGRFDTNQPVDIFPLFGINKCGFLFREKFTQITFNKNLKIIKENGIYDEIIKKYSY